MNPEVPSTANPLYNTAAVMAALNCSRWAIWKLCSTDESFPKPRIIAGRNKWYASEIEDYKQAQLRREYA